MALAYVRTHTFTVTRAVVQVVAVKPRTVLSSPTGITETYGTYAISIMETAVWTVDDYQDRTRFVYVSVDTWDKLQENFEHTIYSKGGNEHSRYIADNLTRCP